MADYQFADNSRDQMLDCAHDWAKHRVLRMGLQFDVWRCGACGLEEPIVTVAQEPPSGGRDAI